MTCFAISVEEVIRRLALKDIAEVRTAVESALTLAHPVIAGLLDSTFDKQVHEDIFFIDPNRFTVVPNLMFSLRLVQGFVWSGVTLARAGSRRMLVSDSTALTGVTDYTVDLERGIIKLEQEFASDWIKVNYTAGFDGTHSAPTWLKEAVFSYVSYLLAIPDGTFDAKTMAAAVQAQQIAFAVCSKIVDPHMRSSSFLFRPLNR